jgi:Family of unknown function (DUF6209)
MRQRVFAREPGLIRFTEDYHENKRGAIVPGQPIRIDFADERIPQESSGAAQIDMYVRYNDGPAIRVPLHLLNSWRDIDPQLTETGEGNFWTGETTPPADARVMAIWFEKIGPSGNKYYDSRFGENYWFRFVSTDLNVSDATVDNAGFHVEVLASPEVSSIAAEYHILNHDLAEGTVTLSPDRTQSGKGGQARWTGTARLAPDSVVSFILIYTAAGRAYRDTNQRRNYLAPDPAQVMARQKSE